MRMRELIEDKRETILLMRDELDKVYSKVPKIDCLEGCADCCGFMPHFTLGTLMEPIISMFNKNLIMVEIANIRQYLRDNGMKYLTNTDLTAYCPYRIPNESNEGYVCAIYPVRPLTCRVFGVLNQEQDLQLPKGKFHLDMKCPHITPEEYITPDYYHLLQNKIARLYDKHLGVEK